MSVPTPSTTPAPSCICPACGKGYRNEDTTCGRADCEDALDQAERLLADVERAVRVNLADENIDKRGALHMLRGKIRTATSAVAKTLYELS